MRGQSGKECLGKNAILKQTQAMLEVVLVDFHEASLNSIIWLEFYL